MADACIAGHEPALSWGGVASALIRNRMTSYAAPRRLTRLERFLIPEAPRESRRILPRALQTPAELGRPGFSLSNLARATRGLASAGVPVMAFIIISPFQDVLLWAFDDGFSGELLAWWLRRARGA